ncbi:phosphoglycerate dehydrogenase [Alphaproteobacteria bacterium]|nr:phosphoglycerate dehydrogenase [Alphaproteobacteria bacterium]
MPKVLISDKLSQSAVEIFKEHKIETSYIPGLTKDELINVIHEFDGLAIRSSTKVTEDIFKYAKNLKIVGRAGIGTDNIDKAAATKSGVIVMNTPYGNAVTTAEHAIALMMSLVRMIPQADTSTRKGKWEKSKFNGTEITGKYLGLIGCGNIGSIVASRALGLKMKVCAFDPFLTQEKASELSVEKVNLDYLLKNSDIISLHTPLTEDTKNIISSEAISIMKKGSRIINCARGGLVDEVACRAALETGHLAGAAFDVFTEEPAKDNILFEAPNFIATPHLGAATLEAQENVAIQIAQQMSDYLNTGAVVNALNFPNVSSEEAPILKPYISLAYLLGSFLGQVTQEGILSIKLELEGKASNIQDVPLMASALVGVLEPTSASVNNINSTSIASSRGINLSTIKHERRCDYETLLKVSIKHDKGERTISGTLIAGNKPRIINIQGIPIESDFPKNALYLRNYDKPGFIGDLGNKLGKQNINIASFHLGRRNTGGEAIALVEVDEGLDEKITSEIRSMPQVARVNAIYFEKN